MSELSIRVRRLQDNGSTFRATPDTLYLGGMRSARVDTLRFELPEEWTGCAVTLHVQRLSGTLPDPQILDENNCVVVDRRWTLEKQGMWMLMAVSEDGYVAMTKPAQYTCYETIDTDSTTETIDPSVYEQFVNLVVKSRNEAVSSAEQAKASEEAAAGSAEAAKTSETHAAASEKAAAESAQKAAASESSAATSEQNAKASETASASSAGAAAQSQSAAAQNQADAEAARDAAAASEEAAKISENNAGRHEQAAKQSEENSKASEEAAKASEEASAKSESAAKASQDAAATSEANALKYSKEAGAKAGTDKTLSIEDAPADAKKTGDELALRYTKEEVQKLIKDCLAAQREEDYAKIRFWISDNPTSPAELFGGTWEQIKDRFILAAGDTYAVGSMGGEAEHTLTIGELAPHRHIILDYEDSGSTGLEAGDGFSLASSRATEGKHYWWSYTYDTGEGQPHNNMPPYITKYVWQRVA